MNEKNAAEKKKKAAAAGRAKMARMLASGAAQPQDAASSSSMDVEDDQAAAAGAGPTVAAQQGSESAGVRGQAAGPRCGLFKSRLEEGSRARGLACRFLRLALGLANIDACRRRIIARLAGQRWHSAYASRQHQRASKRAGAPRRVRSALRRRAGRVAAAACSSAPPFERLHRCAHAGGTWRRGRGAAADWRRGWRAGCCGLAGAPGCSRTRSPRAITLPPAS